MIHSSYNIGLNAIEDEQKAENADHKSIFSMFSHFKHVLTMLDVSALTIRLSELFNHGLFVSI